MSKRLALLVLSLTLVAGCGFKLRGNFELSSALSQISIEGGNRSLNEKLREQLREQPHEQLEPRRPQSGSAAAEADSGGATLFISKSEFQRSVRTVDADGLATGYDYIYTVDYNVTGSEGAVLQPLATISQHRTLDYEPAQASIYEPAQALAIEEEEEFLKQEMEQEIILQLLRRLGRIPEYSGEAQ